MAAFNNLEKVADKAAHEPSADMRSAATAVFGIYSAFKDAGFSEQQAFQLAQVAMVQGGK